MNDEKDPLDHIITRFKYYPSIDDIKSKGFSGKLDFTLLFTDNVLFELKELDHMKSTSGINFNLMNEGQCRYQQSYSGKNS